MEPQIEFGDWYEIDGPNGTEFIPADLVGDVAEFTAGAGGRAPVPEALADYCENREVFTICKHQGWGARLSMPGYLDCTEWTVFETEQEAREHLDEMYDDDEEGE